MILVLGIIKVWVLQSDIFSYRFQPPTGHGDNTKMNGKRILPLLLCIGLILPSLPVFAELQMGVFPRRPVAKTHKMFKPLAEKLSQELGEPVKLVVAKDFKAFWKGVQNSQYDIVHYNQYHYLLSHKNQGYRVIAVNEEFGSSRIAGSLSVRTDAGIAKVEDLRGKTILFGGGKKAMGSFIAPTAILKKAGLEAGKDYTVRFAKNPPSAVIGVFNKAADAAGSGNVILKIKGVQKKIDVGQMQMIAESDEFIHLPWAVKGDMAEEKAERIRSIMISLKGSDDAVLKSAGVTNFVKAVDGDFDKVREIVEFVTGEAL